MAVGSCPRARLMLLYILKCYCINVTDDELLLHVACWPPAETCSQDRFYRACSIRAAPTAISCSGPTCRFGEYLGQHSADTKW